jgi:hypothetical protein
MPSTTDSPSPRSNPTTADSVQKSAVRTRTEIESIIYNHGLAKHNDLAFGETNIPQVSQPAEKTNLMGDKSPKANQKKSSQKQSQANSANEQKKKALFAKQAAGKKK